jgi:hypothetical protein
MVGLAHKPIAEEKNNKFMKQQDPYHSSLANYWFKFSG